MLGDMEFFELLKIFIPFRLASETAAGHLLIVIFNAFVKILARNVSLKDNCFENMTIS